MALETKCQTPGTVFHTEIWDAQNIHNDQRATRFCVQCVLPMELNLDEQEAKLLEANIHNALELVLAPYFRKAAPKSAV